MGLFFFAFFPLLQRSLYGRTRPKHYLKRMIASFSRILILVFIASGLSYCTDESRPVDYMVAMTGKWKPYSYKLKPGDSEILITTCESIQSNIPSGSNADMLRLLYNFSQLGTVDYTSLCPGLSPGTMRWQIIDTDQIVFVDTGLAFTIQYASDTELKLARSKVASAAMEIYITMRRY